MDKLIALVAVLISLTAHVSAQNFQHSCYSESSHSPAAAIQSFKVTTTPRSYQRRATDQKRLTNLHSSDYYLDNGVADGTNELHLEAFCSGGADENGNERTRICTRMKLDDCYKNVNGALKAWEDGEEPSDSLSSTCEIDSCAIMRDAWDGPIMTCLCRNDNGDYVDTTIDLSKSTALSCLQSTCSLTVCAIDAEIGNEGGLLQCGDQYGSPTCPDWGPDSITFLPEEDL